MNQEEMNRQVDDLTAQADEMSSRLEEAREERNGLLRQRFDLKEQRRYFRAQLREARTEGNLERIEKIEARLTELEHQLEELDDQIETLEDAIEETSDQIDDILDAVGDLEDLQDEEPEEGSTAQNQSDKITAAMNHLNGLLQKGFQKVADTLEQIDFEKVGENVQTAANKAAKTVSGVATDAAKTVENAWNGAKEQREKPGGVGDCRISGSGTIDGGCYNRISASGACKVSSDVVCRELRVSGSFRACGSVDCSGAVRASGSMQCSGDLLAGSLTSSGSTKVQQNVECGAVTVSGGLHVGGTLKGTTIRSSGGLHVKGDVEADSFITTGALEVDGMVNADDVQIQLSVSQSKVGAIGGSQVHVTQSSTAGLLSSILKPAAGTLSCDSIEGDEVELTAVKARVVRGARVTIRSGCEIEQVEYTETCTVDGNAHVGNCVKL